MKLFRPLSRTHASQVPHKANTTTWHCLLHAHADPTQVGFRLHHELYCKRRVTYTRHHQLSSHPSHPLSFCRMPRHPRNHQHKEREPNWMLTLSSFDDAAALALWILSSSFSPLSREPKSSSTSQESVSPTSMGICYHLRFSDEQHSC